MNSGTRTIGRSIEYLKRVAAVIRLREFDTSTPEGRSKERYRRILLSTASNLLTRGLQMLVGLVTIPLALSYLGKEKYGLWAVVTSFVAWTALFNFGIVNSLVNALSEANGKGNRDDARSYVSTAFYSMVAISAVLGLVVVASSGWISWSQILAVRIPIGERTVTRTVLVALLCVLASMPLSIVRQIYAAYQKSYVSNLFSIFGSVATLAALYLVIWTKSDLPTLVLAFSGPGVVVSLVNLLYMTRKEMPWIKPKLSLVSRRAFSRLWATSLPLFLYQIGALLVTETQMIVLAHVTSLRLVSEYSIVWRVSVTFSSLIALGTSAFVPAFREAHERGDGRWLKLAFARMLSLRMMLGIAAGLIMIVGGNTLLRAWLHRADFNFPVSVWASVAIVYISAIWVTAFSDLLTIMDRIWVQVLLVFINGITTVLLTVLLPPRWGLLGAMCAMGFVTFCFWTWLIPLLVKPIFHTKIPGRSADGANFATADGGAS